MLNNNHGVAAFRQLPQNLDQLMDVGEMESRRRLVQQIDGLACPTLA